MPTFDAPSLDWMRATIVAAIIEVSIPYFGGIFVSVGASAAAAAAFLACRAASRPLRLQSNHAACKR